MKEFLFNFVFYPILFLTAVGIAIYIIYIVFDFSACDICIAKTKFIIDYIKSIF